MKQQNGSAGWMAVAVVLATIAHPHRAAADDAAWAGVDEIVFALRVPIYYHYYENFGHFIYHVKQAYAPPELADAGPPLALFGEGGRLCRLNLRTGKLQTLLDDPQGGVRDPQVHYDGRKILFSYRPGGQPHYHLYEIQADGAALVPRTDGPYDDIEPTYLPDGGIAFCSSRCRRYVGCWLSPVATLYRCDGQGRHVRPLSASTFTDNTPWPLPDGRLVFTRWEYVDRNQLSFHHLWTANPDGTGVMVYFGNQFTRSETPVSRFSDVAMLDAKPIPGTQKVVASFSPGHGRGEHMGTITIIDPSQGPDAMQRVRQVAPERKFRDPYPISEDCFLAADARGIWVVHGDGSTRLVYATPRGTHLECHEPRPLRAHPREALVPPRVDPTAATGRLVLRDVYDGRNMGGVRRGEIKKLLVLEQLPKPANFSGGQEPLSIGGPFTLTRVLGTVPVEADGSADLEVPALRALFFVALDGHDLAVKHMHSFVSVMPGETTSYVGCHEQRVQAPHATSGLLAAARPASRIEPLAGVPDVFDFPRDVQPILDRHCVRCHNADRWEGRADFSGDRTPLYTRSYWTMIAQGLIVDGRNYTGNSPPRSVGSAASRLLKYFDGSHYAVRATAHERTMVRLWIDSGATYPGTYAGLGSGISLVEFPTEAIVRRCAACHRAAPHPAAVATKRVDYFRFGRAEPPQPLSTGLSDFVIIRRLAYFKFGEAPPAQELCNLSRPEKSILLRAPLAQTAGGLGLCRDTVFAGTDDADYRQLLSAIRSAGRRLEEIKRFDMPGFRPNKYYVRLMQDYGVLPPELAPDEPIDPYATDRAYWQSLWYCPEGHSVSWSRKL